jgi:hypothetical protein
MSVHRKIRREIIRTFRHSPRSLIDAVVVACDTPAIDPDSVRPYSFEDLDPAYSKAMRSMIGWQIDLIDPPGNRFALLLDVATHFDGERAWNWQLWRAEVRRQAVCPTWLAVCVTNEVVLGAIRQAFDHESADLPILVTPDAKVLAVPSRPAPRAAVGFRL